VENSIESITVTVQATHNKARVDDVIDHPLNVGENVITITVTATDGITVKNYEVTVIRAHLLTNVENVFASNLNVFPNPFNGWVHITGAEGCTLCMMNVTGKVVHTQRISTNYETIQLEHLPTGVFFFHFEKDGKMETVKVVCK
jgi:hypothetical protein